MSTFLCIVCDKEPCVCEPIPYGAKFVKQECKHTQLKPRTDIIETYYVGNHKLYSMLHVECVGCGKVLELKPVDKEGI